VVVCLERCANDLHMVQLMLLPPISCVITIQIGVTFLVPAYPGCPGNEAVKWLSVCMLACISKAAYAHKNLDVPICSHGTVVAG